MQRIVLFGQRGSGEISIGEALRERTGESFTDLDRYIVEKKLGGKSLNDFLKERGENGWFDFRKLETEALERVLYFNDKIISLGGGTLAFNQVVSSNGDIISNTRNQYIVKKDGRKRIFLHASPEILTERMLGDTKGNINRLALPGEKETPLEESKRVYAERIITYRSQADLIIEVGGKTVDEIVEEILLRNED